MSLSLTITPTAEVVPIPVPLARVWTGRTPDGVECVLLVAGVVVPDGADRAAFDAALAYIPALSRQPEGT